MKSTFALFAFCIIAVPLSAQTVSVPVDQEQKTEPLFQANELLRRYPKGKTWQALSVLRVNGRGSSQNWGITGESQFIQANQYQTEITILENNQFGQTSTIRLRCKIVHASSSKIVTKQTLRLADFSVDDPVLAFAIEKGIIIVDHMSPSFKVMVTVLKKWDEIDPNYQRTMTKTAKRLGIEAGQLEQAKDLEWMEEPRSYSGCSFEVQWANGIGVTDVKQTFDADSKSPKLSEDDLKSWFVGANPLAELYVFPSLTKRVGDSWILDASRATSMFVGQGDAKSNGEIKLRYERDATYDGKPVRSLFIQNGNVEVITSSDGEETKYTINSMEGTMKVDPKDAMLKMSSGTGDINYSRMSTDHFLFKAELKREISGEWRYEAKKLDQ